MSRGIRGDTVESLESEIESRKPTVVEQPSDGLENEPNHPGWIASEELEETEVGRNPLRENTQRENRAANSLASARRTTRLLWIALIASLCAHCVVPAYIITAMAHPEKVALMDG